MEYIPNVPTPVAGKILGKSDEIVRRGLRTRAYDFGRAVKPEGGSDTWNYHISAKLLSEYTGLGMEQIARMVETYHEGRKRK